MLLSSYMVLATVMIVCYKFYEAMSNRNIRLPPGPRGFPFFGHSLHSMVGAPYRLMLSRWSREYGKMFTIYYSFSTPVVVVSDTQLMKELYRQVLPTVQMSSEINTLLLMWSLPWNATLSQNEGEWLEHITFCMRSLETLAFGRKFYMEPTIIENVQQLCERIGGVINTRNSDKRVFLREFILHSIGNFMWEMIKGKANTGEDRHLSGIADLVTRWRGVWRIEKHIYPGRLTDYEIANDVATSPCLEEMKILSPEIEEFMKRQFLEHRQTRKGEKSVRNVIDAFNEEIVKKFKDNSAFCVESGYKYAFAVLLHLMMLGIDTHGEMLTSLMYYLTVHRDVQRKVQQEIDSVIGRKRNPTRADKKNMPYLKSVLTEAFRFSSSLPTTGNTVTVENEFFYDKYQFPEGTILLPNVGHVNNDKVIWEDPEKFRPERFMEGNDHLKKLVVPYESIWKANPAAVFYKDAIFLYAAKLLQMYSFSADPSVRNVKRYLQPMCGVNRKFRKLAVTVTSRY